MRPGTGCPVWRCGPSASCRPPGCAVPLSCGAASRKGRRRPCRAETGTWPRRLPSGGRCEWGRKYPPLHQASPGFTFPLASSDGGQELFLQRGDDGVEPAMRLLIGERARRRAELQRVGQAFLALRHLRPAIYVEEPHGLQGVAAALAYDPLDLDRVDRLVDHCRHVDLDVG